MSPRRKPARGREDAPKPSLHVRYQAWLQEGTELYAEMKKAERGAEVARDVAYSTLARIRESVAALDGATKHVRENDDRPECDEDE